MIRERPIKSPASAGAWVRNRLLRITTGGDYLPEVDGVRFLAISLVLLQHIHERVSRRAEGVYPEASNPAPGWLFMQGDFGVQLFFTLSGFILFRGLARMAERSSDWSGNYGRYLLRRLTRLEPPYLFVTVGIFAFLALTGYQSGFSRSSQQGGQSLGQSLGASLAYAHTLIFGAYPKLNPPTWSLETEFQFYVLAPAIVWPLRRVLHTTISRLAVLSVMIVVMGIWVTPPASAQSHLSHSLAVYLPLFLVGFLAGEINEWVLREQYFSGARGWVLDVLAGVSLCVLLKIGYSSPDSGGAAGYCVWILALLVGCTGGPRVRKLLGWGFLPVVGGMCYSIYLVHLPFLELAAGLTRSIGRGWPYSVFLVVQCISLLLATLVVATGFYLLVERPCMDRHWPVRLWTRIRRGLGRS